MYVCTWLQDYACGYESVYFRYMYMSTRDSGVAKGRPGQDMRAQSWAMPRQFCIPALHAYTINGIEQCTVVHVYRIL